MTVQNWPCVPREGSHGEAEAERLRAEIEAQRAQRGLLVVTPQALAAAEQAAEN